MAAFNPDTILEAMLSTVSVVNTDTTNGSMENTLPLVKVIANFGVYN